MFPNPILMSLLAYFIEVLLFFCLGLRRLLFYVLNLFADALQLAFDLNDDFGKGNVVGTWSRPC